MTNPQEIARKLSVTQDDRDAAASLNDKWFANTYGPAMRAGIIDDDTLVQTFAAHRHAALEEAAKVADAKAAWNRAFEGGRNSHALAVANEYEAFAKQIRNLIERNP